MKVVWVHSFPENTVGSGVFMYSFAEYFKKHVDLKLYSISDLSYNTSILEIFKKLKAETKNADIVHSQYGSGCGFITSFLKKKKVLSLRGSDFNTFFSFKDPSETIHSMVARSLSKLSLKRFDHITVVSKRMNNDVSNYFPNGKVAVLPSPINLEKFFPINRNESRKVLGFGENKNPWILISSLIKGNPIKRIDLAQQAYKLVKQTMPNVELKFLNNIPSNKVVYWINSSNVILLTSVYEGWPNIIKEGLACNIPFVSTDVGDLNDIVAEQVGCQIAQPTPHDLANKIISVLRNNVQNNNLQKFIEPFSMEKTSQRLVEIYKNVYSQ